MSKHFLIEDAIPIEENNPAIVKDKSKCAYCGMCREICDKMITVGKMYDLEKTNDTAVCINCGQCSNICPTEAITERYDYKKVQEAIKDPEKIVIISTAPAVRVAIGEEFKNEPGTYSEGKMVSAIRKLGADYVFDVTFAADLTITEEASELVDRIINKKVMPQFTSCCPAWVKYCETFYPEFIPNLSSAKSPISMLGATIKTYFAELKNIDPRKIVNVSIAPCTAKKYEIQRPQLNDSATYNNIEGMRDTDYILTTRELAKWIKEENIDFNNLEESKFDEIMSKGTGAGVIFGNTGGVMEAAVRTAYYYITKQRPPKELLNFEPARGLKGIKEAEVTVGEIKLKLAIAHGMANAKNLLDELKAGNVKYDFIEIMNCLGGCIGGGGQPKITLLNMEESKKKRIEGLYQEDAHMEKRLSHENPDVIKIYEEFYKEPLSKIAEELLHTTYKDKSGLLEGKSE